MKLHLKTLIALIGLLIYLPEYAFTQDFEQCDQTWRIRLKIKRGTHSTVFLTTPN